MKVRPTVRRIVQYFDFQLKLSRCLLPHVNKTKTVG